MANDCHEASHNLFATTEWRKKSGGDSHPHICAADADTPSTPPLSPVSLEGGEQALNKPAALPCCLPPAAFSSLPAGNPATCALAGRGFQSKR